MNFQDVEKAVKRFESARAVLIQNCQDEDTVKAFLLADFKQLLFKLGLPDRQLSTDGAIVAFLFLHAALGSEQPWELAQDISGWNRLSANQQAGMGQVARETILSVMTIETPTYDQFMIPSLKPLGEALDPVLLYEFESSYSKLLALLLRSDDTLTQDEKDQRFREIYTLIQASFQS